MEQTFKERRRLVLTGSALVALIAAVKLAVQMLTASRYGFFIDELYFVDCSKRLAWGYVDMPSLVPFAMRVERVLFGDSLQSIRLLPALAGAGTILLTGRLARELGGGRFAQAFAALSALVASASLAMNHYMSMNGIEPLLWTAAALVVARVVNTGNQKLWLWAGLITGIGLNNKYSMLFIVLGVVAGLALTPERRAFLKPWIWLGGALAFVLVLPNLVWNVQHHFPFLEMMANRRSSGRVPTVAIPEFFRIETIMELPANLPVWLAGIYWYLFDRQGKRYRALGYAYFVVLAIMFLPTAKPYYLLPVYPMLFAAGGTAFEKWFSRPRLRWAKPAYAAVLVVWGAIVAPFALPLLSLETCLRYSSFMHFSPAEKGPHQPGPLPPFFAAEVGWEEMAQDVAKAWYALPPETRGRTGILAHHYGQAGAIDFFGPAYGLPQSISGHMNYYLWGPGNYTGESLLAIGFRRRKLEQYFGSIQEAGTVDHPHSMFTSHFTIYRCSNPKLPMSDFWPRMKLWD